MFLGNDKMFNSYFQVNTAVDSNSESKDLPPGNNNTINNREYILDEDECPLAILMNHPQSRGM